MISLSIASATEVYGDASRCEIERHWVDHPLLADVSRSLRALVQCLGEEAADELDVHFFQSGFSRSADH